MGSVHAMWLFFASLLSLIGISFCIDCQHSAVPGSTITVSSTLNSNYGKKNIGNLSDTPWVGGGNSSNWVSLDFSKPIWLTKIKTNGGDMDVIVNGTLVKCFVTRLLLEYRNNTGGPWLRYKKFTNYFDGVLDKVVDIKYPVTSINITIKKYVGCPALNMKLLACEDVNECIKTPGICGKNSNCQNIKNSYLCFCTSGYTGSPCQDIDECKIGSHSCRDHSDCRNEDGGYSCPCKSGYTGDGKISCVDIDECKIGSHSCRDHSDCRNEDGGYSCPCKSGYTGDGKISCVDIDECKIGSHSCRDHSDCRNEDGGYSCPCKSGYTGDGKISCVDIDECNLGIYNCHDLSDCRNEDGGYSCPCKSGYTGDGKISSCVDINECEQPNDCHKYANCSNTNGSYKCKCKKGYEGNGILCSGDEVSIKYKSKDQVLRYGRKLELTCRAVGLPTPTIKWNTPNKGVSKNTKVVESGLESTLVIQSVTLNDDGVYKCNASNNDTNETGEINVTVNDKTIFKQHKCSIII
ncbi:adhesion G -coupled receptor E2-like [Paramuricea clavata]|uniref:Adhesion G -coupled receptor E2-like n=1 Tax=Paramuricea clavata TaxID=317549 RepID=A0A7D9D6C9_PARCT|nr:adhesion G -coupled receptor E2-like [Paramuricea clavata]